ncbi:ABC transporter ATP-binding protein/permease [Thermomonospora umbrina]|uniref:ABC-type transport system involved in cytochrome bd biosynthesis fused ATPase/permease subunit n=1 Tax=Thermomonospora umbrina TaxID=111806 RepID=A0A3D9SHR9_9ACTN|nr:ATP-binding cassette domain-containing protein [Thermomonospora umbrina]REE95237.1 ABC-type transport system involved in cytochrome bd biosynthesis fused ATPase/permease subunit [Thermomonospora umbrina]
MMLHPELVRAARTAPAPLLRATALLAAVTSAHAVQAVLLAVALADIARDRTDRLPALLGAVAGVLLLRAFLTWWQRLAAADAGALIRTTLRDELLVRLGGLGPAHGDAARTGALRATVVDGVEGVNTYLSRYLPQLAVVCLLTPVLLVCVAVVHAGAAVVLAAAVTLALLVPRLWDRALAARGREHWDGYEDLAADYLEALQQMSALRATGAVRRKREALEDRSRRLHRATVAKLRVSLVDTALTDLAVQAGTLGAVLLACASAATGRSTGAEPYLLLMLASECFRPLRDLSREWHAGYVGVSAADGIRTLRTARPAVPDTGTRAPSWSSPPAVSFTGVRFGHPGADRPALDGVDFECPAGRTTALVGPSGAGKSTLLELLQRHHDPDAGAVLIDGVDVRELSLSALRRSVAVVSQDVYLFAAPIADNLRLADPDATDGRLVAACRDAGIHDEIVALPDGYATVLGERGATLSGGQRQRLALARALLCDTPVLVLDEATSAVDERREHQITEALRRVARGRTCLIVAHRLAAVRHADRIVVLDGGRVDAVGDHRALVGAGGTYAALATADLSPRGAR